VRNRSGARRFRVGEGRLLLLGADAFQALDGERGLAALGGDLAVLFGDRGLGRFVAVEAAEQLGGNAAVGALRAVLVENVEKGEFAFGIGTGFLGHGGLFDDQRRRVKTNDCMPRVAPKRRRFNRLKPARWNTPGAVRR
jgi:hypothetical protein